MNKQYNVIASIKYGKKRIGRFGIYTDFSLAEACQQLKTYLNNDILADNYIINYAENVEKQKNYEQCEAFYIIPYKKERSLTNE